VEINQSVNYNKAILVPTFSDRKQALMTNPKARIAVIGTGWWGTEYHLPGILAHPEAEACGWLKDRFGLSWQIVPKQMGDLLGSPMREKALAATNVMLKMKKIVIADLRSAFDQV
jgi:predicted 3-demethylubiquinone-9 3-methyltransferase (glyoxalase superfamily)